jgi:hypothetical protein
MGITTETGFCRAWKKTRGDNLARFNQSNHRGLVCTQFIELMFGVSS